MEAFDVLGDPVRRAILELVADGELAAGEIGGVVQARFGISQPAVSQHLRVLRESGFLTVRAEGVRRLYAIDPSGLQDVDAWLDRFRRFWAPPFAALGTELARGKRRATTRNRKGHAVIDGDGQIASVTRHVGRGGAETRTVTLSQTYDSDLHDVWDACTNPERIPRWFLPVSGDLRLGGRYQLDGNAGGTIEECEPPTRFRATWEFGESVSWIEVQLTAESADTTRLELAHTAPVDDHWSQFGPGAVGIGWDLGLVGLFLHLTTGASVDPVRVDEWTRSAEGLRFMTRSSEAWRDADIASGTPAAVASGAADRTTAAYTGGEPSSDPRV